ncbi:hypothetical protein SAMN06297387_12848 [Streptomyces zhaozhouensis]|uniref:Uncharacterized protein n=1 Tax=Streptomyces zhaozhouensis TaxID=1300267 RepID=A0A286E812_9ACTN|nr:hypothetical protein [Streptomyces zhaozhouensis]SOD67058.1 hypothetical protein SAMN06297387_12848 [Streptomyces zhaozhouensis]
MMLDFLSPVTDWVMANPYLVVAMTVSIALTLTVVLIAARKMPKPLEGIGPQAVVALGGVGVSVYGLWHFAIDLAGLPPVMAVGFIAVFDAAELTLLLMMYRGADPEKGWTPELRLMHRTAWLLVCFSAGMNAVHAPTGWAMPVLGAIPPLAAWLIELKLRAKLYDPDAEDEEAKPGPLRLLILAWQHGWSTLFAVLGLDAADRGSQIARAAMAQRAAARVYRLRLAIEAQKRLTAADGPRQRGRADRRVSKLRRVAQRAIDRADVATDPEQALALARRMAALTGVDGVAQATYSDAPAVMDMLETLAVVPSAQRISANTRAMEAEAARQRAEDARQRAETARQRAVEETDAAREELSRLHTARAEAEKEAQQATEQAENARQEAERAESARRDADTARQRAEDNAATAERRARQLADDADLSRERLERTESELHRLEQQTDTARQGRHGTEDQLAALRRDLEGLQAATSRAEAAYNEAEGQAREARVAVTERQQELDRLDQALHQHNETVQRAEHSAREAQREARAAAERAAAQQRQASEITALLEKLRGDLTEHLTDGPTPGRGGRLFESDAKQAGWELYRAETSAGRAEPSAAELAERFGVAPGNARNWLREFRAARARELARPAARTEPVNGTPIPA